MYVENVLLLKISIQSIIWILLPVWNIFPTDKHMQKIQKIIGMAINQPISLSPFSIPVYSSLTLNNVKSIIPYPQKRQVPALNIIYFIHILQYILSLFINIYTNYIKIVLLYMYNFITKKSPFKRLPKYTLEALIFIIKPILCTWHDYTFYIRLILQPFLIPL